ncbi:MAG: PilZ domain-containing protein [Candidatus Omnitrophica bacterium]|nr:PilZ domain-containing protein [Candidatus Omnitrophota bacterium]MBU4590704.1 PilZ domain-containing protein [Candidatus Omnitrophota bacterium]
MRAGEFSEKRQFKRLDLSLPMILRRVSASGKDNEQEGVTLNVSYNGAYVADIEIKNIKPQDTLRISLSVPRDDARDFPFSRVTGKAMVARVEKDAIALEFSEDINRLFVAN